MCPQLRSGTDNMMMWWEEFQTATNLDQTTDIKLCMLSYLQKHGVH